MTGAQSALGDASGEITQEIYDDFCTAYGEMMDAAIRYALPAIQREIYFTLPADTNVIFPVSLGVKDFDEPAQLWERSIGSQINITSVTDGTPQLVTTATPHGRNTGDRIELNGVQGVPNVINRDWYCTVTGPTTLTLNGSITNGANGTGGTLMYSQDTFIPMSLVATIPSNQEQNQILGVYFWQNNALWFPGSLMPRQLWIQYYASEDPPASGTIGFANGRELLFLKTATASHFAPKRAIPQGPQLRMDAYGESGMPDCGGGFLRQLIVPMLKQKQNRTTRPQRFRRRRGQFPTYL